MKAIARAYKGNAATFAELTKDDAPLQPHDIRVKVEAVSVNPVDYKVASGVGAQNPGPVVLGWDAAGTVLEVGAKVTHLSVGDEVFYAGDITRDGSNCDKQVVDSRIAARKPKNLNFKEAAALPLTAITAWEAFFEGMRITPEKTTAAQKLLVIGGAGGVGSVAIQLAKALTKLTVVATASRPESAAWAKKMGADEIIDHRKGLANEAKRAGLEFDYVLCTSGTDNYFADFAAITRPFGRIVSVVETNEKHDVGALMRKSIAFGWEFMFTRSMFQTPDIEEQHNLLARLAQLVEASKVQSTKNADLGPMTPESLEKAHGILKSGTAIGKIVLGGLA